MSDFDKEAEREKLREKYEQEQQEREATEKMSELLLQGATMTNAHCSECGDPVFRYDGQEFCATCEKAVDRGTDETEAGEESDDEPPEDEERIEVTAPDDASRVKFGGDSEVDAEANQQQSDQPAQQRQSDQQQQGQRTSPNQHTQPRQGDPSQSQPQPRQQAPATEQPRQVPGVEPTSTADVTAARESLVRTLTRFSQQAEATEDPQRAQEYLAAAREAAATLSELRN